MKHVKTIIALTLAVAFAASPLTGYAADKAAEKAAKPKPYPLKKCIVTDEKLGEMGAPYVFTHKGQELKLCCKGCLKDFNKNPEKYMKKLADAEAKAKKAPAPATATAK